MGYFYLFLTFLSIKKLFFHFIYLQVPEITSALKPISFLIFSGPIILHNSWQNYCFWSISTFWTFLSKGQNCTWDRIIKGLHLGPVKVKDARTFLPTLKILFLRVTKITKECLQNALKLKFILVYRFVTFLQVVILNVRINASFSCIYALMIFRKFFWWSIFFEEIFHFL